MREAALLGPPMVRTRAGAHRQAHSLCDEDEAGLGRGGDRPVLRQLQRTGTRAAEGNACKELWCSDKRFARQVRMLWRLIADVSRSLTV